MEDRVSKEAKLLAAKDIVASYVREAEGKISPDFVCELFTKVYQAVDAAIPDPEKRRIGLGA